MKVYTELLILVEVTSTSCRYTLYLFSFALILQEQTYTACISFVIFCTLQVYSLCICLFSYLNLDVIFSLSCADLFVIMDICLHKLYFTLLLKARQPLYLCQHD